MLSLSILLMYIYTEGESQYLPLKGLAALDFAVQGCRGKSPPQPLGELATHPAEIPLSGFSQVRGVGQIFHLFVSLSMADTNTQHSEVF
jgi:hypothetical protein